MKWRKIFKKRYIFLFLLTAWLCFVHSGCLTMRLTNREQTEQFKKQGLPTPTFTVYTAMDRQIQYTQSIDNDTLPVVIFVHGSPGSSSAFIDYITNTELHKQAVLVAVDRPGFGYSGYGNAEDILANQSAMMKPLLEKFGAKRKIILVGHSLGGPLISRMAMDYPELIDGLVIIAGSIDPELEPNNWYRPILGAFPVRYMIPASFKASNSEIQHLKKDLIEMLPLWSRIKVPVTVIQGTKDTFVPPGNADFAKKMLVNSSDVNIQMVEGMNHFVVWTRPEITRQAIVDMLHK